MNDILDRMSVLSVGNGQTNTVYLSRLFYQNCGMLINLFCYIYILAHIIRIMINLNNTAYIITYIKNYIYI